MTSAAEYLSQISAALRALAEDRPDEANAAITKIARRLYEVPPRKSTPRQLAVRIFRRDHFTCRYCHARVVPEPILRLLASVFPVSFPHHPNWKAGRTHPAIPLLTAEVDHVVAGTQGGSWSDADNLVTACAQCNTRKADFTPEEVGLHLLEIADSDWDGLASLYPIVWAKKRPEPEFHMPWLRAYGYRA